LSTVVLQPSTHLDAMQVHIDEAASCLVLHAQMRLARALRLCRAA
jgi:hypothetical protein